MHIIIMEFFLEILLFIPLLGTVIWFSLRNYLVLQNTWIEEYKPNIDIAFYITTIVLTLGYLDEYRNRTHIISPRDSFKLDKNIKVFVCLNTDLNVRICIGKNCQKIGVLYAGTEVKLLSDRVQYNNNSFWIKVSSKGYKGWVNQGYLCSN